MSSDGRRVVVITSGSFDRATVSDDPPLGTWVYFGQDAERFATARRALAARAAHRSGGELVNAAMRDVRTELIHVDEHVEYRSELLWHASDLAERNPYVSSFLYNAAALVAFARLLDDTDASLIVVVEDAGLGAELARLARTKGADVRVVLGRRQRLPRRIKSVLRTARAAAGRVSIIREHARRRRRLHRPPGARPEIDVLIATWAEDATFASGVDTYFGALAQNLRDQGMRVGHLGLLLPGAPAADDVLRAGAAADDVVLVDDCVGVAALLGICSRTLRRPARPARPFVVAGVDLTATLEEALSREVVSRRRCWSLQLAEVGPALARWGLAPRLVVHPFENQAWEKALRSGLRDALPQTEVVGYQHTPTSFPGWYPCAPSRRDLREGQLPDRVRLLGPRWRAEFAAAGYPPERLEVVPPLRYGHLRARTRPRPARSGAALARVLVACSGSFDEALELTVKAIEALGDAGDVELVVKTHPDLRAEDARFRAAVTAVLEGEPLPPSVSFATSPIAELLESTNVLLHTFTAVAWEALAFGVPTVFVASDFWLDVEPLPPGIGRVARSQNEIAAAVRELLAESPEEASARVERGKALLAEAFL